MVKYMNDKMEEQRDCKNCRYYLGRYAVCPQGLYDYGGVCMNINLYTLPETNPCELPGKCLNWESKEGDDELISLI